jgi:MFS family permease
MTTADQPPGRSMLGTVFLTVFLDIVGFSILFPLFPALLTHYLELEGSQSAIGELVSWLQGFTGENQFALVALFGGLLGAIYSLLQFLFAPIWGGLSDRIGRRPTMLFTLSGTCLGYVLWIFAGSFWILILSRLINGIMAGNISTASAVVADTTDSKSRVRGMAMVGMAIGLGFVMGPAIGGSLSLIEFDPGVAQGGLALNRFSIIAAAAAAVAILNLFMAFTRLKETLPPEKRNQNKRIGAWNPLGQVLRQELPGVARITFISFLYTVAFGAMEFSLTFLAAERFGYEPHDCAWLFVFIGLTIAFVQGGFVRRMAPKIGERKMLKAGLLLLLPGNAMIALASSPLVLYAGLFFMATGSAMAMPCMSSLASLYAPPERQGLILGQFRSAGSLARAIGPFLGGILYWYLGSASPYWAASVAMLLPLGLCLALPAPVHSKPVQPE